jgi:hypothetical protein
MMLALAPGVNGGLTGRVVELGADFAWMVAQCGFVEFRTGLDGSGLVVKFDVVDEA